MIKKNNILEKQYYGEKPKEICKREEKIFSAFKKNNRKTFRTRHIDSEKMKIKEYENFFK